MLFVSSEFILFFIVVFGLYWSIGRSSGTAQNIVLSIAGLYFYGSVHLGFLGLLLLSAAFNLGVGLLIGRTVQERWRRIYLWVGVTANIVLLWYFKYFEFFVNGFMDLLSLFGSEHAHVVMEIALPLGISFYTFQMIGYLIDVHNEEIESCRKPLDFLTYVLFFPKMFAGPVERVQHFLPQVTVKRTFDLSLAVDGSRQFLWGMFAKVVLAENCAYFVDRIFTNYHLESGSTILMGACLYFIQLYCDFSGYSNMAIGVGKMFGITLGINFRYPLFATNISDFWRRWHVSLSSWMMDYLYTPLSFLLRDKGKWGGMLAVAITFMAVGIWHGANWTFVLFGAIQSLFFALLVFRRGINQTTDLEHRSLPSFREFFSMAGMFLLFALVFMLMRADTVDQAWSMWRTIVSRSLFAQPGYFPGSVTIYSAVFFGWEWVMRRREHGLSFVAGRLGKPLRYAIYYGLIVLICLNLRSQNEFIYFQF